ncbi:MAG: hypothetical protein ACHQF2_01510 [Flavobacteriales bacterium]
MPKEDYTEREIRKIRQLITYLLKLRDETRFIEMREKLDEVAADNEFPTFQKLIACEVPGFDEELRKMKLNAAVCELYFQLMEVEASLTADEWNREGLYHKALKLGLYSEELDRTFSPYRNEILEKIRKKIE